MAFTTKVIYDTNSGFIHPTTVTESGQPQSVTLQGLTANTGHYVKAEIWQDGSLQNTSSIQSFTTLQAGVITLSHDQTVRRKYNYDVTYDYTSTYAPSYATLSTNGSTFQGLIDSANNKVTFTVSGLTPGNAYLTSVTMGDLYGETETVSGSIVATVVNEVSIVETDAKNAEVDVVVDYVVDDGFYSGRIDYWYSTQDPSQDAPLGTKLFTDGTTVITVDNLTNGTSYKFKASVTLGDETTTISSSVASETPAGYSSEYFTIVNTSGTTNTISYDMGNENLVGMEVSTDNGSTWTTIIADTSGTLAVLESGETVMMRHNGSMHGSVYGCTIHSTGNITARGNIASLTHGSSFIGNKSMPSFAFESLFSNNDYLTDASEISFASFSECSTQGCRNMFWRCRSLRFAPDLPMTTVGNSGYLDMFFGCTSLLSTPIVSATTLGEGSCYSMFHNCTSLTNVTLPPATTMADGCYNSMFKGCTSLTTPPTLPATTLAKRCYMEMFSGCTSLRTAPNLPVTTTEVSCYHAMFYGCTALTAAPSLPGVILSNNCYSKMFYGCTSITSTPSLQATTLADGCYAEMFKNCTSLTNVSTLPVTSLRTSCYESMFEGCTSLTTPPSLPATTLKSRCYESMFMGCTALTTAPTLQNVTTMEHDSIDYMYYGCSLIDVAYAPSVTNWTVYQWLYGVAQSGIVYKPSSLAIPTNTPNGVPSGWTTQDY